MASLVELSPELAVAAYAKLLASLATSSAPEVSKVLVLALAEIVGDVVPATSIYVLPVNPVTLPAPNFVQLASRVASAPVSR